MDSISQIPSNASSDDAATLALDNLSLTEVSSNVSLCSQKDSATEATLNIQLDKNFNETSKIKQLAITQNEVKASYQTQDCGLTILDDCCSLTNNELSLDSTYVVPEHMGNSFRDPIHDKMKVYFVIRQNSHSNSHQQPNSSDCVITLYESSESDGNDFDSSYDSESSTWLDYDEELSYTTKRQSLSFNVESTEELSSDSDDSSHAHDDFNDSQEISNESGEDSNDSDQHSSDSDSASVNGDPDEEPTPSDDDAAEDSDDSSTTSEDKPDSDEESESPKDRDPPVESSSEDESSDDDMPDDNDCDESSLESSSDSEED